MPSLVRAQQVQQGYARMPNVVATTTVPQLRQWGGVQFAATPTPFPVPTPGAPALVYTSNAPILAYPSRLVLWTGDEVDVLPAAGGWDGGTYQWEIPDDAAGWHSNTADCGKGVTVMGGHVAYNGITGVFRPLFEIEPENSVICIDAQGTPHTFEPVDYVLAKKEDGLAIEAWVPDWSPALLLYTCVLEINGDLVVVRFREVRV